MYKTFDDLQRGKLAPAGLEEPLDVCLYEGELYSMSNRRLVVLLMYQALHLDRSIMAPCVLRDTVWKNNKFQRALTTRNNGLGIDAPKSKKGGARHKKSLLFDT